MALNFRKYEVKFCQQNPYFVTTYIEFNIFINFPFILRREDIC